MCFGNEMRLIDFVVSGLLSNPLGDFMWLTDLLILSDYLCGSVLLLFG